ncbi:MAG: hypothetical protein O7D34_05300 [Ignavibacteria bacterium]|nr:hypothetical protein [Ignavibacteria bacterium]
MRIYTWVIFNLRTGGAIFRQEDYEGPVVYAGGGGDVVNETGPTGPFGPQIPFILGLFQEAARLYNQGVPQAFPGVDAQGNVVEGGQLTPDINPNIANTQQGIGGLAGANIGQNQQIQQFLQLLAGGQNQGQQLGQSLVPGITGGINEQLGAGGNPLATAAEAQLPGQAGAFETIFGQQPGTTTAPGTQGGGADASSAIASLLGGGGGTNPFLDQLVQSAVQGQVDQFGRNVLPGIRTEAQQAGQIGGTRQGIAEGIAAGDLTRSIGNITSDIYGNAFGQQLGAQSQALTDVLGAQQADVGAGLTAESLSNQNFQQYIQSLLQGTGQVGSQLGQGLGLGFDAIGTGTAQAGNIFQGGNALQLQQQLGALGLIPGFQAQSLGQFGAINQLGLQEYGLDQAQIDAISQQYYFNQNAPFNLLSQFQQYITGPYGSTVGNFQPTFQPPPIGQPGTQQPPPFPSIPGKGADGQVQPTPGAPPQTQIQPPPPPIGFTPAQQVPPTQQVPVTPPVNPQQPPIPGVG